MDRVWRARTARPVCDALDLLDLAERCRCREAYLELGPQPIAPRVDEVDADRATIGKGPGRVPLHQLPRSLRVCDRPIEEDPPAFWILDVVSEPAPTGAPHLQGVEKPDAFVGILDTLGKGERLVVVPQRLLEANHRVVAVVSRGPVLQRLADVGQRPRELEPKHPLLVPGKPSEPGIPHRSTQLLEVLLQQLPPLGSDG